MAIPDLRNDGYLPAGKHQASLIDIKKRFVKTGHQKKTVAEFQLLARRGHVFSSRSKALDKRLVPFS